MPGAGLLFGPLLLGVMFNCILLGMLVMQCFFYFQSNVYRNDPKWLRRLIIYLFVVEVANTAFNMAMIYQSLILEFGSPDALIYFPKLLPSAPIMTGLVSTPVQIFMAWRIKVITGSKKIPILIFSFAIASFTGTIWSTITVATFKLFACKTELFFNVPGIMWFLSSAIADLLITVCLVYTLHVRRSGVNQQKNDTVNRIIKFTVQTGLVTTIFAICDLLLFTLSRRTTLSFIWDFSISKLYSNALLSILNSRIGWTGRPETATDLQNAGINFSPISPSSQTLNSLRFEPHSQISHNGMNIKLSQSHGTRESYEMQTYGSTSPQGVDGEFVVLDISAAKRETPLKENV